MSSTRQVGKNTEIAAKQFLISKGLIFIEQNYLCNRGEIDLIMRDNDVTVFIEVKYRSNSHYGSGFEVVTQKKQQRIINTAANYLYKHSLTELVTSRFDIVSLSPQKGNDGPYKIDWLKNAFSP